MAVFNDFAMAGRLDDLVLFKCGRTYFSFKQPRSLFTTARDHFKHFFLSIHNFRIAVNVVSGLNVGN